MTSGRTKKYFFIDMEVQLFELMQRLKPAEEIFYVDRLIAVHGHTVLRHMCELNESRGIILGSDKPYLMEYNVIDDSPLKRIQEVTGNADKVLNGNYCEGYFNR